MPGPTVGIKLRVGCLGQGAVHLLALLQRRRPVGRRPHQGMPEPHPGAELHQAGLGRLSRPLGGDPEQLGRPPHQHRVADRLGRRQLEQAPGVGRKHLKPPPEARLDPPGQRHRVGKGEPTGQLRRGPPLGQLHQR